MPLSASQSPSSCARRARHHTEAWLTRALRRGLDPKIACQRQIQRMSGTRGDVTNRPTSQLCGEWVSIPGSNGWRYIDTGCEVIIEAFGERVQLSYWGAKRRLVCEATRAAAQRLCRRILVNTACARQSESEREVTGAPQEPYPDFGVPRHPTDAASGLWTILVALLREDDSKPPEAHEVPINQAPWAAAGASLRQNIRQSKRAPIYPDDEHAAQPQAASPPTPPPPDKHILNAELPSSMFRSDSSDLHWN